MGRKIRPRWTAASRPLASTTASPRPILEAGCSRNRSVQLRCGSSPWVHNVPTINSEATNWLRDFIRNNRLDVLIVDPLVSFHRAPENDNVAMDVLIKDVFGSIAEETNAAVELCHHSGKPKEGRTETAVEDSRGASSIIWAARSAKVLDFMMTEEATKLGIAEDQRRLHIASPTARPIRHRSARPFG
jgi:hypothetical protein